jgi:hypothetical protein
MNKLFLAVVLGVAVAAASQNPPQQQPAQPTAPAQQKKEIKDPAEYNAYVGAVQQKDPAAKISGLEAFLTQYPNSVMKEDALEILMGTYQQTGNVAKMGEAAQRLLQVNPNNVRALALLAYTKRTLAQAGQNPQQNLSEAKQYGQKGLEALKTFNKPESMSEADYEKLKREMGGIFNGAVGIAALQDKDYKTAATDLRAAAEVSPNDFSIVYPLALAYLSQQPQDGVNGSWYSARAANLAPNAQLKAQIEKYGKSQYSHYHGSEDGWTQLMAQTATTPTPPADFTVTKYVPPTPAQQAADLVKNKKVEDMSFAEWQLVLAEGNPDDAEKVWSVLKGKPLQMVAHVIQIVASDHLLLAGSQDDIDAKRADIDLTMTAAIPKAMMPKEDTDFQFEGTPVSYVAKPFVMTMNEGALLRAAPAHKPPVHKRPAH